MQNLKITLLVLVLAVTPIVNGGPLAENLNKSSFSENSAALSWHLNPKFPEGAKSIDVQLITGELLPDGTYLEKNIGEPLVASTKKHVGSLSLFVVFETEKRSFSMTTHRENRSFKIPKELVLDYEYKFLENGPNIGPYRTILECDLQGKKGETEKGKLSRYLAVQITQAPINELSHKGVLP